mmetsp:Transcript_43854/g.87919  ORF Transcript_43854/g.87919 Transcript_43854/m.87919 type:complete len:219 (-) Transcript_43854:21-677(-)
MKNRPSFASTFPTPLVRPPPMDAKRSASLPQCVVSPRPAEANLFDDFFGRRVTVSDFSWNALSSGSDSSVSNFESPGDGDMSRFYGGYRPSRAKSLEILSSNTAVRETEENPFVVHDSARKAAEADYPVSSVSSRSSAETVEHPRGRSTEPSNWKQPGVNGAFEMQGFLELGSGSGSEGVGREAIPSPEVMKRNSVNVEGERAVKPTSGALCLRAFGE